MLLRRVWVPPSSPSVTHSHLFSRLILCCCRSFCRPCSTGTEVWRRKHQCDSMSILSNTTSSYNDPNFSFQLIWWSCCCTWFTCGSWVFTKVPRVTFGVVTVHGQTEKFRFSLKLPVFNFVSLWMLTESSYLSFKNHPLLFGHFSISFSFLFSDFFFNFLWRSDSWDTVNFELNDKIVQVLQLKTWSIKSRNIRSSFEVFFSEL